MASIASTLGSGSGIDTKALVTSLVSASYDPKKATQKDREDANTAKISTLATLSSGIDSFASALTNIVAGGTLQTQPSSSDTSVLTASTKAGTRLGNFAAKVEVKEIAQGQTLTSTALTNANTPVGLGDLTLTTPAGTATITIDASNNSLAGLARTINAANRGVTASVVTDTTGARLVLKGQTGAANGFTLANGGNADSDLQRFTSTGGLTQQQAARNAELVVDGVNVTRAGNTITDLVDGMTLNLVSAKPGTTVTLGAKRPTEAIASAMDDFVSAFNALKGAFDSATAAISSGNAGPFAGNSSIKGVQRQLARMTSTVLNTTGGPQTLAEIGISTNRDGTLSFDRTRLDAQMAKDPDGVEAMFNPTQYSSSPLVKITNSYGTAKPGTYTLSNLVPTDGTNSASGMIGGANGIGAGATLAASVTTDAYGLVIEPLGNVASATVTVDAGLSGALKTIRDQLRGSNGLFTSLNDSLGTQKKSLADQRLRLTSQEATYKDQLTKQFGTMDVRVNAYKATQSYLSQQISIWTKSNS